MTKKIDASIAWPESEWVFIGKIADHWGVTVDYLLQLGARGLLEICAVFNAEEVGWIDMEEALRTDELALKFDDFLVGPYRLSSHAFFTTSGFIEDRNVYTSRYAPDPGSDSDHKWLGLTSRPFSRPVSELVVFAQERDRFEEEHRIGAHAGEMPKPDKIDGRERTTLLQMIRVMDRKLELEDAPKAAARELQEYAAALGFEIRGKADTLADKIREARNLED